MAQKAEELQPWQTAKPIEFAPKLAERTEAQALLVSARQGAGFEVAAGQLGHAVGARATHVMLDYSKSAAAMRYQIDGVWEQQQPLDRETGDAMLQTIKLLCQMNPSDRRSAQSGECGVKLVKEKFDIKVQSQGVQTGERVLIRIISEKVPFERLGDLGMRDKMVEKLKEQLNSETNIVLFSAPKGAGLTTTWTVAINAADRLIRDFQSFEPKESPEPEIINVTPNFFGGDTGRSLAEAVRKMVLKEPDVFMFPNLPDPDAMQIAAEQIEKADRQVITRMVAGSAIEAFVKLVGQYRESAKIIASRTGAVLNQRLVRRLCDNCKVGFEPSAKLLGQLGMPAGRVPMLYRPFILPPIEEQVDENGKPAPIPPCETCGGRGYFGRVAVFELLCPGEKLRAALLKTRDLDQLTKVAKAEGHRTLQAEAVLTVARGLTSLDELKRLFAAKK